MRVSFPDKAFVKKLRIPQKFQISPDGEKLAGYFHGQIQEVFMETQCDECGAVAESVMPESAKDGDIEHTFFRCPDCGAVYPIAATDMALRASIAE